MAKVYNKKNGGAPSGAVYVGRPSKWGNPYTHLSHVAKRRGMFLVESPEEAVEMYEIYLMRTPELRDCLGELRGKDLVCWCTPGPCHADILLELANA